MTEASRSPHPYLTMLVVVLLSRYLELGSSIFPNKLVFGNERGNGKFNSFSKKIDIGRCDTTEIFYVKVPGWQSKTKLVINMHLWLLTSVWSSG